MTTDKRLKLWGLLFALLLGSVACTSGEKTSDLKAYETKWKGEPEMLYGQVRSVKEVQQSFPLEPQSHTSVYTYNYDKQGRILEYQFLTSDDEVGSIGQYAYNADGLKVKSWVFVADTSSIRQGNYNTNTIRRNDYKYDERGLLLEEKRLVLRGDALKFAQKKV